GEAPVARLESQGIYSHLWRLMDGEDPTRSRQLAAEHANQWLLSALDEALVEIEVKGLVSKRHIARPTGEPIDRLKRRIEEFARQRQAAVSQTGEDTHLAETIAELEEGWVEAPVSDRVLALEGKHAGNKPFHESRRMLVRKKRAFELARLLDAKRL